MAFMLMRDAAFFTSGRTLGYRLPCVSGRRSYHLKPERVEQCCGAVGATFIPIPDWVDLRCDPGDPEKMRQPGMGTRLRALLQSSEEES